MSDDVLTLYDVDDLKLAVNNGDGTFGTPIDAFGVSMFRIEYVARQADARGDGGIVATASAIETANITMRNVGIKGDQMALIYPSDVYDYDANHQMIDIDSGRLYPYFSAAVRVFDGESQDGGAIIFVPRLKIVGNVQWQVEDNQFIAPELTCRAVRDPILQSYSGRRRFVRVHTYLASLPLITTFPV